MKRLAEWLEELGIRGAVVAVLLSAFALILHAVSTLWR